MTRTELSQIRRVTQLRRIVDRPTQLTETLACGHTINRPSGLGEDLMRPSKAKRRRCYLCEEAR